MKKGEKQFIYYWHREFGWEKNPFEKKFLFPVEKFVAGYEKERKKLNYFVIDKLPLAVITGREGTGKSMLLLWLKEELNRFHGVVIVDYANKDVKFSDFIKILLGPFLKFSEKIAKFGSKVSIKSLKLIKDKNLVSIYESIYFRRSALDLNNVKEFLKTRLKGRPLVLLVDDFDSADTNLVELIRVLLESDIDLQVAVAGEQGSGKLSKKNAIKVSIDGLSYDECKEMMSRRILSVGGDGLSPFDSEILKILYKKSGGNPKGFLELCREKAVSLALSNLNLKREIELKPETKQQETNKNAIDETLFNKPASKEETQKNRSYEIKVVQRQEEPVFTVINQNKSAYTPKKVEKEKTKPTKAK